MSDDRFKQARRSLIDRNRQRQQQDGSGEPGDDEFHEDEKTLMVNVNELQQGGGNQQQGSSNPPPRSSTPPPRGAGQGGQGAHSGFDDEDDFADAATQMVDINDLGGAPGGVGGGVDESTAPSRDALSVGGASPSVGGASPASGPHGGQHGGGPQGGDQQVFAPGGSGGYEGKTDFINIADFADANAEFAPDSQSAGYEGKTEFVHIDALQGAPGGPGGPAGQPASPQASVANDPLLRQSYQFSPQSIQQGEVTLIFAQNPLGKQVVLRQVWAGDATQMPAEMRQRIARLDALGHPRLVKLNGVVATQTGLWADLAKPEGYRLSAVLQQHGPQDRDNVATWMEQVAEILDLIHGQGLLYGNLTPDAIWIQEDNSIVLEPFDLLSFENRGDLAPYGPPEMKRPPQDRQLSAATDIYSLAAVGAAALTGLPFNPDKLGGLEDEKLANKLRAAMSDNPGERPESAGALAESIGSGGFSLDSLNFNPAEMDIKVVAVIAVLLLGGFAGYMYWNQQQAKKAAARRAQAQAAQQAPGEQAGSEPAAAQNGSGEAAAADGAEAAMVAAPGEVQDDPRLKIHSSYRKNPPAEEAQEELTGQKALDEALAKREAAKDHMKKAEDLASRQDRLEEYTAALENITTAIRLRGGEPTEEDQKVLDDLHSEKLVRTYIDEVRKRVENSIDEGNAGDARFAYKRLSSIDYRARATGFFDHNASPKVVTVHEPEKADKKEDD